MKKVLFLLLPLFLILNVGCSSDDSKELESSNYPVCKNDTVWFTVTDSPGEVVFNTEYHVYCIVCKFPYGIVNIYPQHNSLPLSFRKTGKKVIFSGDIFIDKPFRTCGNVPDDYVVPFLHFVKLSNIREK